MKNWYYLNWKKYLYINIKDPKKTMKKLKGVFKSLKCYFKMNINNHYPVFWCSKPSYIHIYITDVGWKDKYDTPRYEYPPAIWIHLFRLDLVWFWDLPDHIGYTNKDIINDYWEQALWYLYYYNTYSQGLLEQPNIEKAKESWPWENWGTKESSWNDNYLVR